MNEDEEPKPCSSKEPDSNDKNIGASMTAFALDKLPLEVVLQIFKYTPLEDVVGMKNESEFMNTAVRTHLKSSMIGLRRSALRALEWLQEKIRTLPVSQDFQRLELVNAICVTRYVSKEVEVLFATIWRFRDDRAAWNELAPHLVPVIMQFNEVISRQNNMENQRHDNLNPYRISDLLRNWGVFLRAIDDGLEDRLNGLSEKVAPFEIRMIDLLMCAPSFNSQLALRRQVSGGAHYDVYGFFETSNLRPVGRVPDFFSAELNVTQKKRMLTAYLRETVQRENLTFLVSQSSKIQDLERALSVEIVFTELDRATMVKELNEAYLSIQQSPYTPVLKKYRFRTPKELFEEYYVRCSQENLTFTGLQCIVVAPKLEIIHLPLAIPFLRGRRQTMTDHYDTIEMEGSPDISNLFSLSSRSSNGTEIPGYELKPKFQLIIHYRESYLHAPSEIVINIGYDENDQCHLAFHNIPGRPLQPITDPMA